MAKIKMGCISYDGMSNKPIQSRCRALKKLYCSCEKQCSFYKSRKANAELISAEAEAKANKKLSNSITDELIKMKEAEARLKHGWITISGADNTIVKEK